MRSTVLILILMIGSVSAVRSAPAPAPLGRVICRIVQKHQSIVVRASENGPTYAVESKSGETIIEGAGLNKLAMAHPELARSLDTMQADASIATIGD